MKRSYLKIQSLVLFSQLMTLFFLLYVITLGKSISNDNIFQLLLISLMFFDAAYISYKNVKCNKTLIDFVTLLELTAWQFLLSLSKDQPLFQLLYVVLVIITFYQTICFLLSFLFQDSVYLYKKYIGFILKITCLFSIVGNFISLHIFGLLFLVQVVASIVCICFVTKVHWKQIKFFLYNQKKEITFSLIYVVVPFTVYIILFYNQPTYLDNIASYLLIMLSFVSVHSIIWKSKIFNSLRTTLDKGKKAIFVVICFGLLYSIGIILKLPAAIYGVMLYAISVIVQIYNLLIFIQYANNEDSEISSQSLHFYSYSLEQIKREEELKRDFSNYLHDEILQDLLSIKNMMAKSERQQIKEIILTTLDELNSSIRLQMQEYQPTTLKSMTLKENIQSLLDSLKKSFPSSKCHISFDCDDKIFLVNPYQVIIYRMIKELTTNSLKHSQGSEIQVILIQGHGIIELSVIDNGIGINHSNKSSGIHKGLSSIHEQTIILEGHISIKENPTGGTRIDITMPMKGEKSYESFIS